MEAREVTDAPPLEPAERKRGRPPGAKNKPPAEVSLRAVESAWQGCWLLLRFVLSFFGLESDAKTLPAEEARDDAKALLPAFERFPLLARILSWVGFPIVVVSRVTQHFHRKTAKDTESAAPRPAPTP